MTYHSVQLPVDKEDDEEVVGVPEPFKVCTTLGLSGCPSHGTETSPHNPTSDGRTSLNTSKEESLDPFTWSVGRLDSQVGDIDYMSKSVDQAPDYE